MNVIILNGPMGVGKTTVGTYIAEKIPGTAFIDGDWCMDLHPFIGNDETKEMAVDNILHMIKNYHNCSCCNMVILAWVIDDDWVYEKLIDGIEEIGAEVKSFTLVCDEEQLRKQWIEDKSCPWRTEDWLRISINSLGYFSKLKNVLNTSGLSIDKVADIIMDDV